MHTAIIVPFAGHCFSFLLVWRLMGSQRTSTPPLFAIPASDLPRGSSLRRRAGCYWSQPLELLLGWLTVTPLLARSASLQVGEVLGGPRSGKGKGGPVMMTPVKQHPATSVLFVCSGGLPLPAHPKSTKTSVPDVPVHPQHTPRAFPLSAPHLLLVCEEYD